jgi:hypothetical protein
LPDLVSTESVTEEVIKRLQLHIKDQMPQLKDIMKDYPQPNERLQYPSLSIFTKGPKFKAFSPYVFEQSPLVAHKSTVKWVVGQYDFNLQLDLWCRNKEERNDVFDLLFNALNPIINPMGLSLKLKDYYDLWCRYDFVGYEFADSERSAQIAEFRTRVDLLASCKTIRVNKLYVMETIELEEHTELLDEDDSIVSIE